MLAMQDAKAHSLPDDPGERFLLGLKTVGAPAVVCGYLLGLLHSDWERVCKPSEPDFENTIRNASYFVRDIPPELTLWK